MVDGRSVPRRYCWPTRGADLLANNVRVHLNPELEIWLTEEFVNEERPTDGQLYCKIRQYHYRQRFGLKSKWMARLRGERLANLKGLEHEEMTQAFDALLDIPGL